MCVDHVYWFVIKNEAIFEKYSVLLSKWEKCEKNRYEVDEVAVSVLKLNDIELNNGYQPIK